MPPPRPSSRRWSARTRCARVRRELVQVGIDLDAPPADASDAYLRLAPALPPRGRAQHDQPRRHLRGAHQRGVDRRRARVRWTASRCTRPRLHGPRSGPGVRRRQVPTNDRLRRACRSADRRRRPGAPGRAPRLGHHGDARGLRATSTPGRWAPRWSRAGSAQGVVVGDGSDIGGGASIMGTLSGGGTERVRIGERCLLGAKSGLGIALGNDCVVEAGLYVTAGTKVTLPDGQVVKARELSGPGQPAVPAQLRHRRRRGTRPRRARHRPELGTACQRLGAAASSSPRSAPGRVPAGGPPASWSP